MATPSHTHIHQELRSLLDELFSKSPLRRRVAAEALARAARYEPARVRDAYPALVVSLDDESRAVRRAALEAIAALPPRDEARRALQRVRESDVSVENRLIADYVLRGLPIPPLAPEPDEPADVPPPPAKPASAPRTSRGRPPRPAKQAALTPATEPHPFQELFQAIFGKAETLEDLLREAGYTEGQVQQLCGAYHHRLLKELGVTWRVHLEAHFPKRDAHIVVRRAGLIEIPPPTLAALAEELGITRERVRQLAARTLGRLHTTRHQLALSNRLVHAAARALGVAVPVKPATARRPVQDQPAPAETAAPRPAEPAEVAGAATPYEADGPSPSSYLEASLRETRRLVAQGLSPAAIAQARGVVEKTVYKHLAILIARRQVALDQVLPPSVIEAVRGALGPRRPFPSLATVQSRLPGDITLGQMRCVVAALEDPLPLARSATRLEGPRRRARRARRPARQQR